MFEPSIVRRAALEAFVKLDPRRMVRVPGHVPGRGGQCHHDRQFIADPLALRGVKFRPLDGAAILRRSGLIYGLGGIVAAVSLSSSGGTVS